MHKVQIFLEMKQPDKAAAILEQMITTDPRNGQLYKTLAEIYDNNKQPDKATAVLERGQKVIPDDAFVQIGMALHYNKIGDTAAYLTYVKKVVLNKDLDAESQIGFLKAYIPSLQSDSAAKVQGLPMARQLVAMHPDDPDVLVFYAELQQYFGMHDSALIALKKAVALKPSDYGHWEKLLGEFRGKQEADSLIRYSEKAIRMFPVKAFIWYFNAIGHSLKDDYPDAIKSMKKAIQMQPESDTEMLGGMYSEMGNIYHSAKMDDLSDQAFEKALKLTPNDATLLNNYSYFLSERGKKLDEAEKMSKKSLTLMPDQATFLDTYGWIMYKKGNYPKAKEYIEKAILLSGPRADGTLYDHLGNIYYKLNEKGKALENWKISKEKGSDDPFIDKKISEEKLYE
jgi:tetratricopeptide (TPR) repeat protein